MQFLSFPSLSAPGKMSKPFCYSHTGNATGVSARCDGGHGQLLCQRVESPRNTSPPSRTSRCGTSSIGGRSKHCRNSPVRGSERSRMPQASQDTLVEAPSIAGQRQAGTRARFPSPKRCSTSSSAGERRFCPADARGWGYFLLLFLISCSYSPKSPAERAARRTTPRTHRGSLRRLQGLMFGQVPARLRGRKAGSAGPPHGGIPPRGRQPKLPSHVFPLHPPTANGVLRG